MADPCKMEPQTSLFCILQTLDKSPTEFKNSENTNVNVRLVYHAVIKQVVCAAFPVRKRVHSF